MKMKTFWPRGGGARPLHPLDLPPNLDQNLSDLLHERLILGTKSKIGKPALNIDILIYQILIQF